jgi:hypothetical protein
VPGRVTADAIDTTSPPAPSFLPPGPNHVAQALLQNATLRGLTAPELAHTLGVRPTEATQGIASVAGMADRIGRRGAAALRNEPRLALAIGGQLTLDQALSRYSSHMGPIVIGPSPLWASGFGSAGDTNISDQGDPAQQNQEPAAYGGNGGGGGGASIFGPSLGGGASDQPPTPYVDQGGGGGGGGGGAQPGPAPVSVQPSSSSSSKTWLFLAAGAALIAYVAMRKKKR